MTDLVALDLPGGPAFVAALEQTWAQGDAVLVVDQRLPPSGRRELLVAAGPRSIIGPDGAPRPFDRPGPGLEAGDALVAATSGSSGVPKLVVHTRAALEAHARAVHRHLEVDPSRDRWLACLPLSHLGGFGVVARAVLTGTPLTVAAGADPATIEQAMDHGCTLTSLVPAAMGHLDLARFRRILLGGSADPADRPSNVVRTYGLTESGGGVVYDGAPLDGTEVRVVDGLIELRGPTIARGIRAPDGSVRSVADADGWLRTGDLGSLGDGRLTVIGRGDDLIVSGGENVWPEPVEAALRTHPAVAEVAVVGAPDDRWGQRVVAVVVPVDPAAPPSLEALRQHVRATLPAAAAPWELRVVETLPRTAIGKVRRGALRVQRPRGQ